MEPIKKYQHKFRRSLLRIWKLEQPLKDADKALVKLEGVKMIRKMKKLG